VRVYRGLEELPQRRRPTALSIGNFDGVHVGHRRLLARLKTHAKRLRAIPTVITFDPHPQKVLFGQSPPALVTMERKLELLGECGIEQVVILRFTRSFSLIEPEEFIERILGEELRARAIVVGSKFGFGHRRRGDTTMLRSFGRKLGYTFEGFRMLTLGGRIVSSTAVRHAIAEGDLDWANRALGRPHSLPGTVVRGRGRGQALGFPTANLRIPPGMCLPKTGVYAGNLVLEGKRLPSAVSVGTNPTFGENPLSVEAFILDFSGRLYGRSSEVEFVRRLRDEVAFPSGDELAEAMESDVKKARRILRA
jgi:riboflavin kinase/FMN adenylyltransferase